MKPSLTHLLNPVSAQPGSRFHFIQQITFQALQNAQRCAQSEVMVDTLTVQYPEDHAIIPSGFQVAPDLSRSVLDFATFQKPRKLPLVGDLLQAAYENSQSDHLVFTNVDIGLQPHFYLSVKQYLESGLDAFTINRRTISDEYQSLEQLPIMLAEQGQPHRGWDCFVFPRALIPQFQLGAVCVGAPLVGLALLANLMALAANFRQFKDEHLTFHLGDDRAWSRGPRLEYARHNRRETLQLLLALEQKMGRAFPRQSPPGTYLTYHRSPLLAFLYDEVWLRLNPSARLARPIKRLLGH